MQLFNRFFDGGRKTNDECAPSSVLRLPSINLSYAVARQVGGLEGRRPSKDHSFLLLVAGKAGHEQQKIEILGRRSLPKPLHRVSRVNYGEYDASPCRSEC